jgi:hypothetical protein
MYQAYADLPNEVPLKQILNPASTTLAKMLRLYSARAPPAQPMLPFTFERAIAHWKPRW